MYTDSRDETHDDSEAGTSHGNPGNRTGGGTGHVLTKNHTEGDNSTKTLTGVLKNLTGTNAKDHAENGGNSKAKTDRKHDKTSHTPTENLTKVDGSTKALTGRLAKDRAKVDNSSKTHTRVHARNRNKGDANNKNLTGTLTKEHAEADNGNSRAATTLSNSSDSKAQSSGNTRTVTRLGSSNNSEAGTRPDKGKSKGHDTKGNDGSCYYLLVDPRPGEAPDYDNSTVVRCTGTGRSPVYNRDGMDNALHSQHLKDEGAGGGPVCTRAGAWGGVPRRRRRTREGGTIGTRSEEWGGTVRRRAVQPGAPRGATQRTEERGWTVR